jgi:hypothetical protein
MFQSRVTGPEVQGIHLSGVPQKKGAGDRAIFAHILHFCRLLI